MFAAPNIVLTMIAIISENIVAEGREREYLDINADLFPELERIEGFISVERFQSVINPEKILSLSFWKDEESIRAFRNLENHREAEVKARSGIFSDYRIRVAIVVRDYGMNERNEAPDDSKQWHDNH